MVSHVSKPLILLPDDPGQLAAI